MKRPDDVPDVDPGAQRHRPVGEVGRVPGPHHAHRVEDRAARRSRGRAGRGARRRGRRPEERPTTLDQSGARPELRGAEEEVVPHARHGARDHVVRGAHVPLARDERVLELVVEEPSGGAAARRSPGSMLATVISKVSVRVGCASAGSVGGAGASSTAARSSARAGAVASAASAPGGDHGAGGLSRRLHREHARRDRARRDGVGRACGPGAERVDRAARGAAVQREVADRGRAACGAPARPDPAARQPGSGPASSKTITLARSTSAARPAARSASISCDPAEGARGRDARDEVGRVAVPRGRAAAPPGAGSRPRPARAAPAPGAKR